MESKALDKSIAMEPVTFLETPQMIAFFASQKSRGLSTFRLPEVRPICTFPMKQLEYLENAWVIFFKTFTRDIPKRGWFIRCNNKQNWHVHQKKNVAF